MVEASPAVVVPITTCLLALIISVPLVAGADEVKRPNILLIVRDNQSYPDLDGIGTKPVKTPNLDRLVAEGGRATSFYVTWPACTPSRGSLLTGRDPQRNGLYAMVRNDLVNYGHRSSGRSHGPDGKCRLPLPRGVMVKNAGNFPRHP